MASSQQILNQTIGIIVQVGKCASSTQRLPDEYQFGLARFPIRARALIYAPHAGVCVRIHPFIALSEGMSTEAPSLTYSTSSSSTIAHSQQAHLRLHCNLYLHLDIRTFLHHVRQDHWLVHQKDDSQGVRRTGTTCLIDQYFASPASCHW